MRSAAVRPHTHTRSTTNRETPMKGKATYAFWMFLLTAALPAQIEAQRAIDPTRWDETMEEFAAEDAVTPPPADAIVVTGSSSIARWHPNIVEDLSPLTIIPRGFGGSAMADVLHHLDRLVLEYEPRAVAIYEGDNDISLFGVEPETVVEQFRTIVDRIHAELPETRIYILSVKPSVSRWDDWPLALQINERYREIASTDERITYVDVATPLLQENGDVRTDIFVDDDLHLNAMGEDIWAEAVRDALMAGEAHYETEMEMQHQH